MKFTLEIDLGNEAMITPMDVAKALWLVANLLQVPDEFNKYDVEGHPIRDTNGNRVGAWYVQ